MKSKGEMISSTDKIAVFAFKISLIRDSKYFVKHDFTAGTSTNVN